MTYDVKEKAYENHLKSKKHLEALKAFQAKENRVEIENNRRNRKLTEETTMEEDIESDDEEIEEVMEFLIARRLVADLSIPATVLNI